MGALFYQKHSDFFFDSYECLSVKDRTFFQRQKLKKYIENCLEYSEFYRRRLPKIDWSDDFPLLGVEPLTSKDLRENLPPFNSNLIASKEAYTVFQSGGTTGGPKTSLFSDEELEKLNKANARGFFALGVKPHDPVADFFASGSLYMTFIHINRCLQKYGCVNFPFANHTEIEFIHKVVSLFQIGTFTGVASYILQILRQFDELKLEKFPIKKILFGGEPLFEADKRELVQNWGVEVVAAPGYGTIDSWYIGYQCLKSSLGVFHAHDDEVYIEIINEETGKPCAVGEAGMVYVTTCERSLTPIVRYRVGDLAYFTGKDCPCGRTTPLFKLLGRGDDTLRIGYDSIDYNFIQDFLAENKLSGTAQIQKLKISGRDALLLNIESLETFSEDNLSRLKEKFYHKRPAFYELLSKKQIEPLQIKICEPNSLKRNPRTGKLIRVLDYEE
jgi:phenylacetate-coenzyme A ligase PaaK-like adenylate-forming protein